MRNLVYFVRAGLWGAAAGLVLGSALVFNLPGALVGLSLGLALTVSRSTR